MNTSRRLIQSSAIAIMAMVCSIASYSASDTQDAAREFVSRQKMGSTLPYMALATAARTQTYANLVAEYGKGPADAKLGESLKSLLPEFQKRWDSNLADAYAKHFTVDELLSLANEGHASKFASKVHTKESVVADDMQATSKPILAELVAKALELVLKSTNK